MERRVATVIPGTPSLTASGTYWPTVRVWAQLDSGAWITVDSMDRLDPLGDVSRAISNVVQVRLEPPEGIHA
jgi:hypothetical protein